MSSKWRIRCSLNYVHINRNLSLLIPIRNWLPDFMAPTCCWHAQEWWLTSWTCPPLPSPIHSYISLSWDRPKELHTPLPKQWWLTAGMAQSYSETVLKGLHLAKHPPTCCKKHSLYSNLKSPPSKRLHQGYVRRCLTVYHPNKVLDLPQLPIIEKSPKT